jgi:hypothetical protein
MVWPSQLMRCMVASPGCTAVVCIPRLFIPLGSPPRHSGHSCTQIGRTRAKPALNDAELDAELDVPGIVIAEVVGGVVGCLFAIAGAVILCKAWLASVVKRGGRDHREPLLTANGTDAVVLGGGTASAATPGLSCRQTVAPSDRTGPLFSCRRGRRCRRSHRRRLDRSRRRHGGFRGVRVRECLCISARAPVRVRRPPFARLCAHSPASRNGVALGADSTDTYLSPGWRRPPAHIGAAALCSTCHTLRRCSAP